MNLPAYPKTKPSGTGWLGDVPEHWDVRRLKFSVKTNPVKSELIGISDDTEVSFVPMDAVGEYGGMNLEKEKLLNEVYTGYTYFLDGDVVIAKITPCFENGKGAIADGLKNGVGFGTTEFHVLRAEESCCDRRFLFYLTISYPFRKIGASEMLGAGGQKRVPEEFIKNLRFGIPPIFEQQAIAEFLDRKTGQIDELIGKKKELIQKLNEQRSALITDAVTGKLQSEIGNHQSPMVDSGVSWLGRIPEHWDVQRLKFSVRTNPVKSEIGRIPNDTEVSFIPMEAVGELGGMRLEKEKPIEDVYTGYTYFADGDVVIAKITPCFENGKGAIAQGLKNGVGFGTTEFHVLRAEKSCDRRFLFYLTISHPFRKIGASEMLGAGGQKRVPEEFIKNLRLGISPPEEQNAIAEYLDEKTGKIDGLIRKTETAIQTLEEYRTALITAAVTGKVDVRSTLQYEVSESPQLLAAEEGKVYQCRC